MALLTAINLQKAFGGHAAVAGITLQIVAGQLIALLGPNGAGKSTTIQMLIGMMTPDAGTIVFDGAPIAHRAYRRRIGVVFQGSVLDGALTVRENLALRESMYRDIGAERVDAVLAQFHLTDLVDQPYQTLSGGQRRRVDIARAVLHQPDILFLDEPSTGLDVQTRRVIWTILDTLRADAHLTIVLTTHYLEEAEGADYVYVLDHGAIIAADTVANLKRAYAATRLTLITGQHAAVRAALPADWPVAVTEAGLVVAVPSAVACVPVLAQVAADVDDFEIRKGTVDDIFLTLTGKEMR